MSIRALLAAVLAGATCLSCDGEVSDLPPVARTHESSFDCGPERFGSVAIEIANAGDALSDCDSAARKAGCRGLVRFDVAVDEAGQPVVSQWRDSPEQGLRECIDSAVRAAALAPATDCRGEFVAARTTGAISWDFGERGYSSTLANVGGTIPALDPSCISN